MTSNPVVVKLRAGAEPTMKAPKHLSAAQRALWLSLATTRELEPHDLRMLTLAMETLDLNERARKVVERDGPTYAVKGRPRVRPEVAVMRDIAITYTRIMRELAFGSEPPPEDPRPPGVRRGPRTVST